MKNSLINRPSPRVKSMSFTTTPELRIDPSNGLDLDRTSDIDNHYKRDREGLETYFDQKRTSISSTHVQDSNSAAVSKTPASELQD